jgi:hypothetical protein
VDTAADLILLNRDLRETWQGRVLAAAEGRMMVVASSILAHTYDEAMAVLFRVVKPKCWDAFRQTLRTPFLCSAGKIDKRGRIFAQTVLRDGRVKRPMTLFKNTREFEYECRKLADRLKLSDDERVEFFTVAKNWVVCDYRIDPTMDPKDPDARRLVIH